MCQEFVSSLRRSLAFDNQLKFNEERHEYSVRGLVFTSATTALKEVGIINDGFYNDEATERGTRVHKLTELYDLGELDWGTADPGDLEYLTSWLAYLDAVSPEILAVELKGCHPLYHLAGTLDRLFRIGTEIHIVDIKSGYPAKWHELQMGLYRLLVERAVREVSQTMELPEGDWDNIRTDVVYINPTLPGGFKVVSVDPPMGVCQAIPQVVAWKRSK